MKNEITSFLHGGKISISLPFHLSSLQIYFRGLLKVHQFSHSSSLLLSYKKTQPILTNPAATLQEDNQSELHTHHSQWCTIIQGVLSPSLVREASRLLLHALSKPQVRALCSEEFTPRALKFCTEMDLLKLLGYSTHASNATFK